MEKLENIIIENKNLIYSISNYFSNYKNKEDLFQVGCIGLINAYNNYRDDMNTKFTSYAYPYILGEMKKLVREDKGIKISRDITKLNLKIEKARLLLSQKLMKEPSISELASFLEMDEYKISECLNSVNNIQSLDEPVKTYEKDMSLYDLIGKKELDINSLIALKEELNLLTPFEKKIIENRYMKDFTQTEVSEMLGISQVQVSRNEQKVLRKLRDKLTN